MHFDPQSNIIAPETEAVEVPRNKPAGTVRTVPVTLVLGVCVLMIAGFMWLMVGPGIRTSLAAKTFDLPQPIAVTARLGDDPRESAATRTDRRPVARRQRSARPAISRTVAKEEERGNKLVAPGRAHYFRGRTYLKEGRIDEAVEALSEAVRLAPDDADAHYKLGLAYVGKRDRVGALQELALLEELDPSLASLLGNLVR